MASYPLSYPRSPRHGLRSASRSRGTVILLVVAALALLAVLGTAYIVAARVEKGTARAGTDSTNLEFARDAVLNQVAQLFFDYSVDSTGAIGGVNPGASGKKARYYTLPEAGTTFGQADHDPTMRDEQMIVADLYLAANGAIPPWKPNYTRITGNGFNPSTGAYDIIYPAVPAAGSGFWVVDPNLTNADAYVNLLAYSSPSGLRYRYGLRIVDSGRMANLNVGFPANASANADPTGTFITSLYLATQIAGLNPPGIFDPGDAAVVPGLLDGLGSINGRRGQSSLSMGTPGVLRLWQDQVLRIERPSDTLVQFFDPSDELELRSYGIRGTGYTPRPASLWPNTLGANRPTRRFFTAYSFTRNIHHLSDAAAITPYTLTPPAVAAYQGFNPVVWPIAPRQINVNLPIDISGSATPASVANLATVATNLATVMQMAGYTKEEALAFAANYLTYRWNGATSVSSTITLADGSTHTVNAYTVASPSFIDEQGICVRTNDGGGNPVAVPFAGAGDLKAPATQVYMGYVAQPFINEIAAAEQQSPTDATITQVTDVAVELYNPYPVPLSLEGYKLRFQNPNDGTTWVDVDLADPNNVPANKAIDPNGYMVIVAQTGNIDQGVNGNVVHAPTLSLNTSPNGSKSMLLMRRYVKRDGTADYAPVDQYDYTALVDPANLSTQSSANYCLRRSNDPSSVWFAAVHGSGASTRYDASAMTLGGINPSDGPAKATPLYDRFAVASNVPTQGSPLANIADFNRMMRTTNACTATGDPVTVLSAKLNTILNTSPAPAPYDTMDFPEDARLHFDFKGLPGYYSTTPTNPDLAGAPGAPVTSAQKPGDVKAVAMLDYLAFVDRATDLTIDIGAGPTDINKVRLPGRLNVNTTRPEVLAAVPNITPQMVSNIWAYRDRALGQPVDPNTGSPITALPMSADFRNQSSPNPYPGHGIRSMAELLVPLANVGTTVTSLDQRDQAWAKLFNQFTVASDTFVVYGYIEAIRANPAAGHNNAADWYDTTVNTGTTDNAANPGTAKNIRVAKRRFVALVDRSTANKPRNDPAFSLPRVVAIRDLPQ